MDDQQSIHGTLDKDKREFRLLRLVEGGGDDPNDLYFELHKYSLNNPPEYAALSYRQGNEIALSTIHVNEQPFPPAGSKDKRLPPNLYEYLRIVKAEQNFAWVFVDAICINQADNDEKGSQISLMGYIYSGAHLVVAWQGVSNPDWDFFCRTIAITSAADNSDSTHEQLLPNEAHSDSVHTAWDLALHATCERSEESILSALFDVFDDLNERQGTIECGLLLAFVLAFMNLEYWSRVRIVQEVLLSRQLVIQFRRTRISADLLERVACRLRERLRLRRSENIRVFEEKGEFLENVTSISIPSTMYWAIMLPQCFLHTRRRLMRIESPGRFLNFADAVRITAIQKCELPFDKIFSLLGITQTSNSPRYHAPATELFMHALLEALLSDNKRSLDQRAKREFGTCSVVWHIFRLKPLDLSVAVLTLEILRMCNSELGECPYQRYFEWAAQYQYRSGSFNTTEDRKSSTSNHQWFADCVTKCIEEDDYIPGIADGGGEDKLFSVWQQHASELKKSIAGRVLDRGIVLNGLPRVFW